MTSTGLGLLLVGIALAILILRRSLLASAAPGPLSWGYLPRC